MEQQLRNLTYGKALLIGLVLAAIYYFSGMYNDGSALEAQIKTAKETKQKSEAEIESINRAMKDAERYKETMAVRSNEMEGVLKAIPSQLSQFDLMKIISNEAKAVGLQINNLGAGNGFRDTSKKDFFEPVSVVVNFTGNYNQVMLFLSNLTKLDKIITVRKLSFSAKMENQNGSKKPPTPIIQFTSELSGYKYMNADEKAGAPGAPASKKED